MNPQTEAQGLSYSTALATHPWLEDRPLPDVARVILLAHLQGKLQACSLNSASTNYLSMSRSPVHHYSGSETSSLSFHFDKLKSLAIMMKTGDQRLDLAPLLTEWYFEFGLCMDTIPALPTASIIAVHTQGSKPTSLSAAVSSISPMTTTSPTSRGSSGNSHLNALKRRVAASLKASSLISSPSTSPSPSLASSSSLSLPVGTHLLVSSPAAHGCEKKSGGSGLYKAVHSYNDGDSLSGDDSESSADFVYSQLPNELKKRAKAVGEASEAQRKVNSDANVIAADERLALLIELEKVAIFFMNHNKAKDTARWGLNEAIGLIDDVVSPKFKGFSACASLLQELESVSSSYFKIVSIPNSDAKAFWVSSFRLALVATESSCIMTMNNLIHLEHVTQLPFLSYLLCLPFPFPISFSMISAYRKYLCVR